MEITIAVTSRYSAALAEEGGLRVRRTPGRRSRRDSGTRARAPALPPADAVPPSSVAYDRLSASGAGLAVVASFTAPSPPSLSDTPAQLELRIGRDPSANDVLAAVRCRRDGTSAEAGEGPLLSRRHCRLVVSAPPPHLTDGGPALCVTVADLGSANGTFVNQRRVAPGSAHAPFILPLPPPGGPASADGSDADSGDSAVAEGREPLCTLSFGAGGHLIAAGEALPPAKVRLALHIFVRVPRPTDAAGAALLQWLLPPPRAPLRERSQSQANVGQGAARGKLPDVREAAPARQRQRRRSPDSDATTEDGAERFLQLALEDHRNLRPDGLHRRPSARGAHASAQESKVRESAEAVAPALSPLRAWEEREPTAPPAVVAASLFRSGRESENHMEEEEEAPIFVISARHSCASSSRASRATGSRPSALLPATQLPPESPPAAGAPSPAHARSLGSQVEADLAALAAAPGHTHGPTDAPLRRAAAAPPPAASQPRPAESPTASTMRAGASWAAPAPRGPGTVVDQFLLDMQGGRRARRSSRLTLGAPPPAADEETLVRSLVDGIAIGAGCVPSAAPGSGPLLGLLGGGEAEESLSQRTTVGDILFGAQTPPQRRSSRGSRKRRRDSGPRVSGLGTVAAEVDSATASARTTVRLSHTRAAPRHTAAVLQAQPRRRRHHTLPETSDGESQIVFVASQHASTAARNDSGDDSGREEDRPTVRLSVPTAPREGEEKEEEEEEEGTLWIATQASHAAAGSEGSDSEGEGAESERGAASAVLSAAFLRHVEERYRSEPLPGPTTRVASSTLAMKAADSQEEREDADAAYQRRRRQRREALLARLDRADFIADTRHRLVGSVGAGEARLRAGGAAAAHLRPLYAPVSLRAALFAHQWEALRFLWATLLEAGQRGDGEGLVGRAAAGRRAADARASAAAAPFAATADFSADFVFSAFDSRESARPAARTPTAEPPRGCALAHEGGLGKAFTTLAFLDQLFYYWFLYRHDAAQVALMPPCFSGPSLPLPSAPRGPKVVVCVPRRRLARWAEAVGEWSRRLSAHYTAYVLSPPYQRGAAEREAVVREWAAFGLGAGAALGPERARNHLLLTTHSHLLSLLRGGGDDKHEGQSAGAERACGRLLLEHATVVVLDEADRVRGARAGRSAPALLECLDMFAPSALRVALCSDPGLFSGAAAEDESPRCRAADAERLLSVFQFVCGGGGAARAPAYPHASRDLFFAPAAHHRPGRLLRPVGDPPATPPLRPCLARLVHSCTVAEAVASGDVVLPAVAAHTVVVDLSPVQQRMLALLCAGGGGGAEAEAEAVAGHARRVCGHVDTVREWCRARGVSPDATPSQVDRACGAGLAWALPALLVPSSAAVGAAESLAYSWKMRALLALLAAALRAGERVAVLARSSECLVLAGLYLEQMGLTDGADFAMLSPALSPERRQRCLRLFNARPAPGSGGGGGGLSVLLLPLTPARFDFGLPGADRLVLYDAGVAGAEGGARRAALSLVRRLCCAAATNSPDAEPTPPTVRLTYLAANAPHELQGLLTSPAQESPLLRDLREALGGGGARVSPLPPARLSISPALLASPPPGRAAGRRSTLPRRSAHVQAAARALSATPRGSRSPSPTPPPAPSAEASSFLFAAEAVEAYLRKAAERRQRREAEDAGARAEGGGGDDPVLAEALRECGSIIALSLPHQPTGDKLL